MLNFALLNMAQDGSRIYMASVHFLNLAYNADILSQSP